MTRRAKRCSWTAAVLVGVASVPASAFAQQATAHEPATSAASAEADPAFAEGVTLAMLRSGDVAIRAIAGDTATVRTGYAAAIVRRPIADIVAAIHDVQHYPEFIPQFEQSRELSRGPHTQDVFVRVAVAHITHLWARVRYRDETDAHGVVEIVGRAIQGNVQHMEIRWRATPIDNGAATVLECWSLVLPALSVPLPTSLLEHEQQSAARRGVLAVRARVEGDSER